LLVQHNLLRFTCPHQLGIAKRASETQKSRPLRDRRKRHRRVRARNCRALEWQRGLACDPARNRLQARSGSGIFPRSSARLKQLWEAAATLGLATPLARFANFPAVGSRPGAEENML